MSIIIVCDFTAASNASDGHLTGFCALPLLRWTIVVKGKRLRSST